MTLHEAIGVRVDTDIKTGEKLTHSEIYGRAIEFLGGLDEVARFVPFPVETLRKKLKSDPFLNNTAMSRWDAASGFVCRRETASTSEAESGRCTVSTELTPPVHRTAYHS